MAEIISVALLTGQLFPLLIDVCETLTSGSREIKIIARNVESLSVLLRELVEVLDKGDAAYPPGIRQCAQQVSEDCNDTCTELKGLILKMEKKRSTKVIRKRKLNDLQMQLELQKSTLLAIISMASLTRKVLDIGITSDPPNGDNESVEQKRADVSASLAKALRCDKMRLLQESFEERVDRSDTASPASDSSDPSDSGDISTSLLAPSQNNLTPLAKNRSLTRYVSPCPSQASLISRGSDFHMERNHERDSPSRLGEASKVLLNLLSYWAALQELCDSSQQGALREDGKGSSSREVAQLYRRDLAMANEMHHRLGDVAARGSPPDRFSSIDAKALQQSVPRTRADNALSQPLSGTGGFRFSVTAPGNKPQGAGYYDDTPPGLLCSSPIDGALRTLAAPSQPHAIQNNPPDCQNKPLSPVYSTSSLALTPSPDHSIQNVEHHQHTAHHHTAPHRNALMPVSYEMCDSHHCRTNCPTTNARQIDPLSSPRFSRLASSPTAPNMFPRPKLSLTYPDDNVDTNPTPMADEFWNVLQANGGVQWETRKKRKDRLLIRQYLGPIIYRQGEAAWSDLSFWGSAWTSLPRRYCSRAVLLGLPYEFREDDRDFHIVEELDYRQVEEITRLSLRTLECRPS